jgi:hypothetical protein
VVFQDHRPLPARGPGVGGAEGIAVDERVLGHEKDFLAAFQMQPAGPLQGFGRREPQDLLALGLGRGHQLPVGPQRRFAGAHIQASGPPDPQSLAGFRLQGAQILVGLPDQGRQAGPGPGPGQQTGGAAGGGLGDPPAFQHQRLHPRLGQVVGDGAAHHPGADDDGVRPGGPRHDEAGAGEGTDRTATAPSGDGCTHDTSPAGPGRPGPG